MDISKRNYYKNSLQTEISSFDLEETILEENHACNPKNVHELVGRAAAAQWFLSQIVCLAPK